MKNELNDSNSVRLLSSVTAAFVECVYYAFLIITMFQYENYDISMLQNLTIQLWAFSQVLKIYFSMYVCDQFTKKAMRTGVFVHRLMAVTKDLESREEVRLENFGQ